MASAEEMSGQVAEMSAQARGLAATAGELKLLVTRFRLDDDAEPALAPVRPLRRAA